MWQNLFATCFPFRNRLTFFIPIKPEHSFSGACFSFFRLQIYSVFPVFSCTFIQFYSTIVHKSIFYIKKTAISSFLLAKGLSFSPTMHKIRKQGFFYMPRHDFPQSSCAKAGKSPSADVLQSRQEPKQSFRPQTQTKKQPYHYDCFPEGLEINHNWQNQQTL